MAVHKFVGTNSTDGLGQVRQQLGGEAVILASRDTPEGVELIAMTPEELNDLSQDRQSTSTATVAQVGTATLAQPQSVVHQPPVSQPAPQPQGITMLADNEPAAPMDDLMAQFSQVKSLLQAHLSAKAWAEMQQSDSGRATAMRLLLNAGFSPQLCADLVERMPDGLDQDDDIRAHLSQDLTPRIQTMDPLALFDPGGVFAFIGPTGVGKTTAIAKIAARCVLRYGREQMALMTTDNFRIGAQEQLKVYARILGIPFVAVQESEDFAQK